MKNGEYTMIVQNFRKKPVVIQAVQLTNDNVLEAFRWCDAMEWSTDPAELKIKTLEGVMTASEGDYIICGVSGEFYPCKPDIFAKTYDVGPDTAVLAESERDALRTRAEVAEGQRDQAKMRVEAVVQEFYGQSMTEDEGFIAPDFFAMAREILNLRAERDALLVINGDLDRDGKLLEAERDALLSVYEAAEDFIGAQGTQYESDQYLMLCGVVGTYNLENTNVK